MKIEQIAIYESIEKYLDDIPVIKVKKGQYITGDNSVVKTSSDKFYVIQGNTRVFNRVGNRKIRIDDTGEDAFTGNLSNVHQQHLKCDIKATEETVLLELTDKVFNILMEDPEFARIFYYKTSLKVYQMYKRMLINNMYTQKEILASHIVGNAKGDYFACPKINDLCEILGFSRRNLYNTLNGLIKDGFLERMDDYIYIKDKEALWEEGKYILEDMYMQCS